MRNTNRIVISVILIVIQAIAVLCTPVQLSSINTVASVNGGHQVSAVSHAFSRPNRPLPSHSPYRRLAMILSGHRGPLDYSQTTTPSLAASIPLQTVNQFIELHGFQSIQQAIEMGESDQFVNRLAKRFLVKMSANDTQMVINRAFDNDERKVVEVLMKNGAPVDHLDYLIRRAGLQKRQRVIDYLLSLGASTQSLPEMQQPYLADETGGWPLEVAAAKGDIGMAVDLLNGGVDVHDGKDAALRTAAKSGNLQLVSIFLQYGADVHADSDYPVRIAALMGDLGMVKYLHHRGANIHAKSEFALRWAAYGGHYSVVKYLLGSGADAAAENEWALHWSASRGHKGIVKLLLDNGASPQAEQAQALRWAAMYGQREVVKMLLARGADVNALNGCALKLAATHGHLSTVRLLLAGGADAEYDDRWALRAALENGYTDVARAIERAIEQRSV